MYTLWNPFPVKIGMPSGKWNYGGYYYHHDSLNFYCSSLVLFHNCHKKLVKILLYVFTKSNCQLKVKITNEWQEQVTWLGQEIGHRNYSMIDEQPLSTHVKPGEARLNSFLQKAVRPMWFPKLPTSRSQSARHCHIGVWLTVTITIWLRWLLNALPIPSCGTVVWYST